LICCTERCQWVARDYFFVFALHFAASHELFFAAARMILAVDLLLGTITRELSG